MTQRPSARREMSVPPKEVNPWAKFTKAELETKLGELRKLIHSGMLTDRSLEHQFTEVGIIENELAGRNGP